MARAAVIPPVSPPKQTGRGRPRTRPATQSAGSTKTKLTTTKAKTATATSEQKKRVGVPATKKLEAETDDGTDDEIDTIQSRQKSTAVKSRTKPTTTTTTTSTSTGRGRKAATPAPAESEGDNDDDELAEPDIPKKRVGRPKSKPVSQESEVTSEPVKRGRGRPPKTNTTTAAKEKEKAAGRKKTQTKDATESSAQTAKPVFITTNSAAMKSNLLRGPAKKKTVTFKDLSDSEEGEELPAPPAARRRRGTGVQESLDTKAARKPAPASTRGRKPAAVKKGVKPLSPKKANQVVKAYASSDGEEDELSGAKNQINLVVDSPIKHGPENSAPASPVRRVNFTPNKSKSVDENGEPTLQPARLVDFSDSVYMSSPARRPSASPFQYTMRETPRRGGLNLREGTRSQAQPNLSPIQDSPLKTSPKKANFGSSSMGIPQPNFSPAQSPLKASPKKGTLFKGNLGSLGPLSQPDFGVSSPLKTSPKKANLGASFSQSLEKASSTPLRLRTSLIQSPAKKIRSPFKGSMAPRKSPVAEVDEIETQTERRVSVTDDRIASGSPSKAGSPQNDALQEQEEDSNPASPTVSKSETEPEAEDELEPMAGDDAVTMIEKPNTESELIADENHYLYHAEDAEDRAETEIDNLANQPEGHADDDVDDLRDENLQGNVKHHTHFDTYDCDYLQEEVKDNIEEYENQLNRYSEIGQLGQVEKNSETEDDPQNQQLLQGGGLCIEDHQEHLGHRSESDQVEEDDNDSQATEDMPDQHGGEMIQEGRRDLEDEAQAVRVSPPRLSIPYGLEDVFTDTPLRQGFNDEGFNRHTIRAPREKAPRPSIAYNLQDMFVDTPRKGGFKGGDFKKKKARSLAPRMSAPYNLEHVFTDTPRRGGFKGEDFKKKSRALAPRPSVPFHLEHVFTDTPRRGGFKDVDFTRNEARAPREVGPRSSAMEGLKDIFTDTPRRGGFKDEDFKAKRAKSPRRIAARPSIFYNLEHLFTDTPKRGGFKSTDFKQNKARTQVPRASIPYNLEHVFVDTPKRGGFTENAGMREKRDSPEQLDENNEESADEHNKDHSPVRQEQGVEKDEENTHKSFDDSQAPAISRQPASPFKGSQGPASLDENPVEESVDYQDDGQDMQSEPDVAEGEDGDTRMELFSPIPHPISHEISDNSAATPPQEESTTPLAEPPVYNIFTHSGRFRENKRYSMESSDENTSVLDTRRLESATGSENKTPSGGGIFGNRQSILGSFTPLADQLSQWKATSPENAQQPRQKRRGVFSLGRELKRLSVDITNSPGDVSYPDISNDLIADTKLSEASLQTESRNVMAPEIFEDQEQEPETPHESPLETTELERQPMSEIISGPEHRAAEVDHSATSLDQDNRALTKENSSTPSAPSVYETQTTHEKENIPAAPAAPVTPMKNKANLTHTLHTVSKVPLKPEGEVSPLKSSRKRGRSLSTISPIRSSPRLRKSISSPKFTEPSHSPRKLPKLEEHTKPRLRPSNVGSEISEPRQSEVLTVASPAKSPRKSMTACSQVLQGAIVHVDVHTTEGEDASGIFIELLQQMGARCVKNWAWNPRSSLSPVDGAEAKEGRVGISHVVFKDGGVRTLEKVRQAGGLVKCVGVGWVLE